MFSPASSAPLPFFVWWFLMHSAVTNRSHNSASPWYDARKTMSCSRYRRDITMSYQPSIHSLSSMVTKLILLFCQFCCLINVQPALGMITEKIGLVVITLERYFKIVHAILHRKYNELPEYCRYNRHFAIWCILCICFILRFLFFFYS